MSISQFDDAITTLQKTGDIPGAGVDPVDSAIEQVKRDSKTTLQQNMVVAATTTPDRAARVANISKEINLNPRIVDSQLEKLETTKSRYLDYDRIIDDTPSVAEFLKNPQNASVARDDIDSLNKIDYAGRLIKPKRPNEYAGLIPEMDRAAEAGFNNLGSSATALALAFGYGDRSTIETQASYNKRVQEIEKLRPDYSTEFSTMMQKEGGDVNRAFNGMRASMDEYEKGNIMEALKVFHLEGARTVGEILDMAGKAMIRPKGLAYSITENLPNALPSIGSAGVGALGGPVTLVGGAFLGGAATEIGSEINSELSERGVDITDPDALERAYQDPTFMSDIRGRAARKGITTAAVDALFAMFAGGKLAKAKGGIKNVAKEAGKELVQETSGEILGEFGGQVAREKGDFDKVDLGASIQEGITALGQSSATIAVGASYRKALNADPVKATKEIVTRTSEAVGTLQKLQGIGEIADAVSGSKNFKNVPSMVSELVDMATGGEGATKVYFQVDDHDNYWSKKGVPPAKAAEDILGDGGKAYADAKATGGVIEVPISKFITNMAQTPEDLKATLEITRVSPDGMTLNEANEHLQGVGATMKELAAEVSEQVKEEIVEEQKPKGIKENIRQQLVNVGMTNERAGAQAELVSSFFSTIAEREGLNADQIFDSYNLRISQANQPTEGALNQEPADESNYVAIAQKFGDNFRDEVQEKRISKEDAEQIASFENLEDARKFVDGIGTESRGRSGQGALGSTLPSDTSPRLVNLPKSSPGASQIIRNEARSYMEARGETYRQQTEYAKADPVRGKKIAQAFAEMKHDPQNAEVQKAYAAMIDETLAQFQTIKQSGIKIEVIQPGQPNPYPNGSQDLFDDVKKNNHIWFFPTEQGFGTENAISDNPLLAKTGEFVGDFEMTANDVFRVVHDYFGHVKEGVGFGPHGEENAWQAHVRMYSPLAARAMTTETRGQNSYVNFGPHGEKNQTDKANTVYADQKVGLLPEWVMTDGLANEEVFNQGGDASPLGQFFMSDGQANIALLQTANPSTFLHETGHFFLEVFGDIASREDATPQTKQDYQNLLKFLGVESREQIQREQHEKFAEGFETYLMEGKAPSKSLKRAFYKFKVWLTSVYRSLKNRGIKFTPEVVDIMDRLLATEQEIAAAKEDAQMDAMADAFPEIAEKMQGDVMTGVDEKAFGLTGEKADRMRDMREEVSQAASEELTQKLMKDFQRQHTKEYKAQKAMVQEQVTNEIEQLPIYKQIDTLRLGMLPDGQPNRTGQTVGVRTIKLDRKGLDAKYLPKGILAGNKDVGMDVNEVANLFGYESGETFLEALQNTPAKRDFIYAEVDRRMHEQYPDLMRDYLVDPEMLEARAREVIHNEKGAQLKRMEFEAIAENLPVLKDAIRQVTRRLPSEQRIREQAAAVVGKSSYQNNRPNQYRLAERRYAKLAGQALTKGDLDLALEYKRKELYNFELYRESVRANEMVEKYLDKFAPIVRKSDEKLSKTRDTNLVNAARAVLAMFGIGKADKAPADYLKQLKEYDSDSYETMLSLVESATESPKSYDQISINQFVEMADSVMALWDLSKSSREMEVNGEKMLLADVRDDLVVKLGEITKTKTGSEARTKSYWDKIKTGLIGVGAAMARAESLFVGMDGSDNKVFHKYIWSPIKDSLTKYRIENAKVKNHFKELLKAVEPTLHGKEIKARELVDSRGRTFIFRSKAQLLGALTHIGNGSNKQKLLVGRGWGTVDDIGNLNSAKWESFVNRMIEEGVLTKADFDFVQAIWDMNEAYKPLAQQTHKALNGFYFNEVTAEPFTNKFGTYRGGYVPAVADMNESQDARKYDEKMFSVGVDNSFMFPSTPKGFTKSRVENYATPLSIDLEMIPSHLDKMIKYIYVEPKIKAAARLVINKDFQGALAEYDETMFESMLMPWLQRAATQVVMTPMKGQAGRFIDNFLRGLRNRVAQQSMFANVVNTLQQPVGLSVAAVKVKPRYLRNALWRYVKGPSAMATDIVNVSEFMEVRLGNQLSEVNGEIKEILTDNKFAKAQDFARKNTYVLQSITQNVVDIISWSGAYDQALENGLDHDAAVKEADSAVRLTQGGMDAEDVSRVETGNSFYRLFNMFSGYFNTQSNLLRSEYVQINRELGLRKGAGRGLYVYTMGFMIPAVMSAAIVQAFKGKLDEDDDDQYMDDVMGLFFLSQFKYATAMFPFGGNVINSAVNRWNTTVYDDAITTSPAIAMIESTVASPKSVYDAIVEGKNKKKAVRDGLTAIGLLSGLPTYALSRPVGYLIDVEEGKADPKNPVDFARGVVSGQRGSK